MRAEATAIGEECGGMARDGEVGSPRQRTYFARVGAGRDRIEGDKRLAVDHQLDAALRGLLPPAVAIATETDPAAAEPLLGSEERAVRTASTLRRQEFALGRTCGRRALRQLGCGSVPIGVGDTREPLWPRGIVGSITHCGAFWAAAVARRAEVPGIGIDAAANRTLEPAVRELIVACAEEAALAERSTAAVAWDVVLFSVKETVFKAWWPAHRQWLEFGDVKVTLDEAAGSFGARIASLHEDDEAVIRGRFTVVRDLVISAATLGATA